MNDLADRVIADTDGMIVIDKPAGISSVGMKLDDSNCVQFHVMEYAGGMVWAVHQLDKETSGVNLFVREKGLVERCRLRMTYPAGTKRYLALCEGSPARDSFTVDAPIGPLDPEGRFLGVSRNGRSAISDVTVRARGRNAALVEVRLHTGRTHQIRIHLSHVGHALLGETWYRPEPCQRAPRQMLHANSLTLGPDGDEPAVTFTAPPPPEFLKVAVACRLGSAAAP